MTQPQRTEPRPAPRLTLLTPRLADVTAFVPRLAEVLGAADIAAVTLKLAEADERTQINRIKTLVPLAQQHDVALLLDGAAALAVKGGADGAHLTGLESFLAAVGSLKPARIAGCGGLTTRHDAMTAAERGADYVMFGEPVNGRRPAFEAILDRVTWWAELFEVPCVGYAAAIEEIGPLARAGADFIALDPVIWDDERGAAAAVAEAIGRLTTEVPA